MVMIDLNKSIYENDPMFTFFTKVITKKVNNLTINIIKDLTQEIKSEIVWFPNIQNSEDYKILKKFCFEEKYKIVVLDENSIKNCDANYTEYDYLNDYIYPIERFTEYSEVPKIRNVYNYFCKNYNDFKYKTFDGSQKEIGLCKRVYAEWLQENKNMFVFDETNYSLLVFQNENYKKYDIYILFVEKKCIGFCVVKKIDKILYVLVLHTLNSYKGSSKYLLNRVCNLYKNEVVYVNYGSDVGNEGLRRMKTLLKPCFIKKCYKIKYGDNNEV
jgi:hypothetical protein